MQRLSQKSTNHANDEAGGGDGLEQAWLIYRLHWEPQKQQRLRRERHLAAYKRYCDECWDVRRDVRRDVRTASHLVEALTWLSRFCLMSQGAGEAPLSSVCGDLLGRRSTATCYTS